MTSFRFVISLGHIKICLNLWLSSLVWRDRSFCQLWSRSKISWYVLWKRKALAIRKVLSVAVAGDLRKIIGIKKLHSLLKHRREAGVLMG